MAKATGFQFDKDTGNISMNSGDTGSFWVHAVLGNEDEWTEDSRMLFTVRNSQGEIVMQRIYRLDDQWDQGDGWVLIEFHNSDTDEWESGQYTMERRYNVDPIWNGTPSGARCVDALTSDAEMVEGNDTIRTVFKGTLNIESVDGRI